MNAHLAKAPDFVNRLSFRVKVRAPLSASHLKAREAVFEYLFETEKLDNRQRYAGVEA